MIKIKFISRFLFIALLAVAVNAQSREQCTVSGRIVDDSQRPAPNAYLLWDPGYGGGIDYITISGRTDAEGRFTYQESCPIGRLRLFATASLAPDVFTPILPPFTDPSKLAKRVAGLSVVKNEKGDLDLGDVPAQVYYASVTVQFLDKSSAPLVSAKDDWKNVRMRLRDKDGKTLSDAALPPDWIEKAVRVPNSSIAMQLPVGEWFIELSPDQKKGKWLKPDKAVVIQRSIEKSEISLLMSADQKAK